MTKQDETTLLIKLPPELKAAFQGLCKARGVPVSAELRRFMADELANTVKGMTTKPIDTPQSCGKGKKVQGERKSYKDAVQADLSYYDASADSSDISKR